MIKWDRPCYKCLSHYCDLSCKESAQPKQEPVAWLSENQMKAMIDLEKQAWIKEGHGKLVETYTIPLYTHPQPKREQDAAIKTLAHLGYTYLGGEMWKPPIKQRSSVTMPCGATVSSVYEAYEAGKAAQPTPEPINIRERWNIELDGDDLLVCMNDHEKSDGCQYERYVHNSKLTQPKREWVGLADNKGLVDFGNADVNKDFVLGAFWAEDKLKGANA